MDSDKNFIFEAGGWVAEATPILTAQGEIPAGQLAPGDLLVTIRADGPPLQPLTRLARRRFSRACHPEVAAALICARAGAFAPAMPAQDLWLSPNQLVYVDGALIAIAALGNGTSIFAGPAGDGLVYVRLELAAHDVVLAAGLPLASAVAPQAGCVPLHPQFCLPAPADLCLPLLQHGPAFDDAVAMLAHRASLPRRQPARLTH